ncbi:MAG TPA: hypothetical protein VGL97_12155, partial [Bryobacteraceae bacterium]
MNYRTVFGYDSLRRTTSVTTPDQATVTTSYLGNATTVTDAALHARRSYTGALGNLMEVDEDPGGLNYQTLYTQSVLGDLRKVMQGSQIR